MKQQPPPAAVGDRVRITDNAFADLPQHQHLRGHLATIAYIWNIMGAPMISLTTDPSPGAKHGGRALCYFNEVERAE